MNPRTYDQIYSELGGIYDPQVASIRQQQSQIPGQLQAEEAGLQAKQTNAFDEILGGARRRGLGFSGIPIGEQAKYTATDYLPAVARLRQAGQERQTSLEDAILGIQEKRSTFAQQLRQQELDRAEAARQAAAARAVPTFGNLGNVGGGASATASQRGDKGFNFTDANGQSISAAAYAAAKGIPFRQLLQHMADSGDQGAKQALGFVGDDFGYDPGKVNNQNLVNLYNSLVWGTGRNAALNNFTQGNSGLNFNLGGPISGLPAGVRF